jgi:PPM family protein phosphatase
MSGPAFPFRVVTSGLADIGRLRKHNEDSVLLRDDLSLYLVADGAGGHDAGNVASALACTTIAHYFEKTVESHAQRPDFDILGLPTAIRRLSSALHRANSEVLKYAKASKKHKGMGTTIVAAWLDARTQLLHVGHVGDSRCYRLRGKFLEALTHDHSLVNEVLELQPELDDEAIARLPKHVITRALGMDERVRTTLRSYELAPDDRYLLCSDGLHGALTEQQIGEALALEKTPEDQVKLLIEMAKEAGSRDNIAAVVIECDPVPDIVVRPRTQSERPPMSVPSGNPDDAPEIVVLDEVDDLSVIPNAAPTNNALRDALAGLRPKRRNLP